MNLDGTKNLFEAINGRVKSVIYISGLGVFGDPGEKIIDESYPRKPNTKFVKIRLEAEKYLGKKHSFSVRSFVELVDEYVTSGRIQLEKDVFEGHITYHDPCNIGRRGGIIDAPRNILKALTGSRPISTAA